MTIPKKKKIQSGRMNRIVKHLIKYADQPN